MHKLPAPRYRADGSIIPPVVKLTTHNALTGPVWFDMFTTRVLTSGRLKGPFRRKFGRPPHKNQLNATQRRTASCNLRDLKRHIMGTSDF